MLVFEEAQRDVKRSGVVMGQTNFEILIQEIQRMVAIQVIINNLMRSGRLFTPTCPNDTIMC